jgi:hypothetical protein
MMPWTLLLWIGCSEENDDSAGDAEADADTDTDTDIDTDTDTDTDASCTVLTSGHWSMDGTAFGMAMDADLDTKEKGCSFTFSNWNMSMSVPEGGTVSGSTVALTGDSYWATCTGTAASETEASGACSDDGGSWAMTLAA